MTEGVAMGEVDEVQDRVMEIAALLKKKAPHLAPSVIPRPYKHAAANIVTLCSTPRQRADAEAFLASKAESATVDDVAAAGERGRGEEGQQIESEDAAEGGRHHVVLETETDIATRTFRITAAKLGGRIDATLSDLNLLMDLHLNAPRQELEPYVERFAAANELDPSTAALALHGACSLAYALQVATSSIAGWNGFVGSHPLPLAGDVDMTVVMNELFRPPPTPPASPRSRSKSKTKGKKGGAKKKKAAAAGGESGAAGVEGVVSEKGKTAKKGSKRKKQG
ncbi:hypothetical protein Esi_0183_0025 [Ectocarpus siliculosus]|uniref:Uncharacterized protein n=1 Tax=Ectocarpus siliculosus TaxID=2880 RepID=D7FNX6_ECTSI|nr:hypothetical protein Esi_0183_0025 [Ectocarpus siliculosus]|eukprot:CBJ30245.1 hypothetical protein Esi_0183_0025 [Ectocarpus siliculosus]